MLVALAAGLLPVLLFLLGLRLLDSFKLIHGRTLAMALAAGVAAALVAWVAQGAALAHGWVADGVLRHVVGPALEETLKAMFVLVLLRTHRVGFMVDAAIAGFAVGAGFAIVENLYYAGTVDHAAAALWLVRGLGTAIMHGSTTAMFGIVGKALGDRSPRHGAWATLPGLVLAFAVHAAFNLGALPPLLETAAIVVTMPLLMLLVVQGEALSVQLNREFLAIEVIRSLVGGMGLIAAVPLTTGIAAPVAATLLTSMVGLAVAPLSTLMVPPEVVPP